MPSPRPQAVVFAPDSFKGSISASAAASALAAGWVSVRPNDRVVLRPMADGGEGTLDAFEAAVPGARRIPVAVDGPDGVQLDAWGARLIPGCSHVVELVGLPAALSEAVFVVTGEGSCDGQSAAGKAPSHVAETAVSLGLPVALAAGRISPDAEVSRFFATTSLTQLAGSPDAAMDEPARWLTAAAGAALARSAHQLLGAR